MTWQQFLEEGAHLARRLNGDPKFRIFVDGTEIDLDSFNFKLIKDDNHNYELILSN